LNAYDYIVDKIKGMKTQYPSLRSRTDDYIFSALCVKVHFYRNPGQVLNETDLNEIIVDGCSDGGVDILLTDPNSEASDLVIGQSKFYKNITKEIVLNALLKMASFYKDMTAGHYEQFNSRVQSRFLTLNPERGEEAKVHFVFYTSAPKKQIDVEELERKFRGQFSNSSMIELSILFAKDIQAKIKTAEDIRQTIEHGKIQIDKVNNFLLYGDDAAIVNVSAYSIKQLYAEHNTNLLSQNLRYHISGGNIDREIRETIKNEPASFWLKNNGITIICDDFRIDGTEVHLRNFSIVNGGQTTYVLHKSSKINATNDLWLPCKIIKTLGVTDKEKSAFSLEIAKAANSQKAIKPADLKANSPEQRSFSQTMRAIGIFYQTKRGENVPSQFETTYLHTKLLDVGKLCLAAIFQEPCKSRSKPSEVYKPEYYNPIFNGNQKQIADICKELLYIDDYFTKKFLPKFDCENKDMPDAANRIPFAHTARTICIAFTALAARYHYRNLTDKDVTFFTTSTSDSDVRKMLHNLGDMKSLLPIELYTDAYDVALNELFEAIIEEGMVIYSPKALADKSLTPANFLKKDANYYEILKQRLPTLSKTIRRTFTRA